MLLVLSVGYLIVDLWLNLPDSPLFSSMKLVLLVQRTFFLQCLVQDSLSLQKVGTSLNDVLCDASDR